MSALRGTWVEATASATNSACAGSKAAGDKIEAVRWRTVLASQNRDRPEIEIEGKVGKTGP